jgi:hypothetical protein
MSHVLISVHIVEMGELPHIQLRCAGGIMVFLLDLEPLLSNETDQLQSRQFGGAILNISVQGKNRTAFHGYLPIILRFFSYTALDGDTLSVH